MITLKMVKDGMAQGLIRIADVPLGAACRIGAKTEYFYFGGPDTIETTAQKYEKTHTKDEIAKEVFQTLDESFKDDPFLGDEYNGYEEYLNENLCYAVLFKNEETGPEPANFYKVPHELETRDLREKALLKIAENDFKEYFEKNEWHFFEGTFKTGAIRFTDGENKTYVYELVSAKDLKSIGYEEVILMLESGKLPLEVSVRGVKNEHGIPYLYRGED